MALEASKKTGLLDRVKKSLDEAGVSYIELGGVVPNPRLSLVRKGIDLCKKEGVDFFLVFPPFTCYNSCRRYTNDLR